VEKTQKIQRILEQKIQEFNSKIDEVSLSLKKCFRIGVQ